MDFRSLGSHFGRLGVASGVHFGRLGLPLDLLRRYLGVSLGVLGGCGVTFWGSGAGHLRRAVVAKDRLPLSRSLLFNRFWRPKGAQKAFKMEVKSVKHGFKNLYFFV